MYCSIFGDPRRPAIALFAACMLLGAGACSRSHTSSITVKGTDGKTASIDFNQNKVPGDYPKDVPVYSSAKVVMSQSFSEKHSRNLVLESPDAYDTVVDFYKKGLESNGWKSESSMATPQLTILTAKKDNREMMLQISDNSGKRGIMQVVTDKQ